MNSAQDTRYRVGCPIRRSRDQRSLASPPGFSQRATSFIASQCQGIHQMPFFLLDPGTLAAAVAGHPSTPDNRRAQGQAPISLGFAPNWRGFARRRGVFHEDTSSDGPAHEFALAPRRRPPRSHSQIHFTRSINTAPDTRPPARDESRPVYRTPGTNLVFSKCRRINRVQRTEIRSRDRVPTS
jgi:hypothetical protein